jgi:hypothetical protein
MINDQCPNAPEPVSEIGHWDLKFVWYMVLEIWSFGSSPLVNRACPQYNLHIPENP